MTQTSQAEGLRAGVGTRQSGFGKYAWFVLAYNIGVVLWGAYVRATGSGAGCGAHWPLCNGEVIPQSPSTARLIEFSHRATSGLTLVFVVGLVVWAWSAFPRSSPVRTGAGLALVFTITEALVGAGLVLFQLVAQDASWERALVVAVHLVNTFLLLACLVLTAWWASGRERLRVAGQGRILWLLGLALAGVLVLGVSGAVTALGDTLFPASSLAQGLRQDLDPTSAFLIRLRFIHPFVAIAVGAYVLLLVRIVSSVRSSSGTKALAVTTVCLVLVQWAAGIANIYLLAPVWMQIVHLLIADLVWLALVLLTANVLAQGGERTDVTWSSVVQAIRA